MIINLRMEVGAEDIGTRNELIERVREVLTAAGLTVDVDPSEYQEQ